MIIFFLLLFVLKNWDGRLVMRVVVVPLLFFPFTIVCSVCERESSGKDIVIHDHENDDGEAFMTIIRCVLENGGVKIGQTTRHHYLCSDLSSEI